jgi:hypothetical protein
VLKPQPSKGGKALPREIADKLRQLSIECSQLAKECSDMSMANEIEELAPSWPKKRED